MSNNTTRNSPPPSYKKAMETKITPQLIYSSKSKGLDPLLPNAQIRQLDPEIIQTEILPSAPPQPSDSESIQTRQLDLVIIQTNVQFQPKKRQAPLPPRQSDSEFIQTSVSDELLHKVVYDSKLSVENYQDRNNRFVENKCCTLL